MENPDQNILCMYVFKFQQSIYYLDATHSLALTVGINRSFELAARQLAIHNTYNSSGIF